MKPITLYNTRTRQKDVLDPLDPENVRMYVCGPTVYDRAHIGNARPVVVFDVLFRLLRHTYGADHVTYVRNLTDVDDKINARAAATKAEGETELQAVRRITDETIGWYHSDMDALGALRPTHEPRATEFIAPMVAMIETLIAKGNAYAVEGHVLFEVATDPEYGTLARRDLEDMRAGARVEVAPWKRDPMDFVLWKPSDATQPGWDSPWGRGRPGWHIECSAMAHDLLGPSFDIHGGGIDLVFPHHENECAQSRCAHPEGSLRQHLDAQRLRERRRREDVEIPRQFLHRARSAGQGRAGRGDPLRARSRRITGRRWISRRRRSRRRRRRSSKWGRDIRACAERPERPIPTPWCIAGAVG